LIKENYEEFQLLMTISTFKGSGLLVIQSRRKPVPICSLMTAPPHLEKKAQIHLPSLPTDTS